MAQPELCSKAADCSVIKLEMGGEKLQIGEVRNRWMDKIVQFGIGMEGIA